MPALGGRADHMILHNLSRLRQFPLIQTHQHQSSFARPAGARDNGIAFLLEEASMKPFVTGRRVPALVSIVLTAVLGGATNAVLGTCGPFTDTANDVFCGFILEVYYLAITTGTTPTTFDPAANVTRTQMAAFLSRTVDRTLQRGSRRAALKQFWTPQNSGVLALTTVGSGPTLVESDGADIWVVNGDGATVSRVRGSDGKLLETWSAATSAFGVLVAMGRVFVTGEATPGKLYRIDPSQTAGAVELVASNLGPGPGEIAFDG